MYVIIIIFCRIFEICNETSNELSLNASKICSNWGNTKNIITNTTTKALIKTKIG